MRITRELVELAQGFFVEEVLLLCHPFVPIARVNLKCSVSPLASGPSTTAVVISGYVLA
jgi:hypothetical protein